MSKCLYETVGMEMGFVSSLRRAWFNETILKFAEKVCEKIENPSVHLFL